jgi:hypothetical protein
MFKKLMMLVLAAFAVVMAVPSTRAQFVAATITPAKNWIGERLAPKSLKVMADQLDVRLGRGEGMPADFNGWLRRDFSGSEVDPWGRSWYVKPGRRSYMVGSMGPDGEQGTGDDITQTRNLPGVR